MATLPVMSILGAKTALNAVTALVGSSPGIISIYSGAQPATTLTADSGTKLSTLTCSSTAFAASTNLTGNGLATATANTITSDTNAAASGTAGYFRLKTATGGTTIFQGNVGTSGADLNMNTTTISAGDTVAITSFLVTLACGDGSS
jgi:hypothetical protein